MADNSKVTIQISGDSSELIKSFEQVSKGLAQVGKDAEKSAGVASSAFSSFLGNLGAQAVSAGLSALRDGFSALVGQLSVAVSAAQQQEDAINKLNFALAASGRFSEDASSGIQKFATELQSASKFGDEVIIANAALIQSFAQLDEDGLKRATQAAADLSAAYGIDFESASRIVGKAAQGNVASLQKLGITIEDTGDKARDYASALEAIEQRTGGAAKAATNTFSGALTQTGNLFSDLQEELGLLITTNPAVIAAVKGLGDIFQVLLKSFAENKDAINAFITEGILTFIDGIGFAGRAVTGFLDIQQAFSTFFTFLETGFLGLVQGFNALGIGIIEAKRGIEEYFGASTAGSDEALAGLQANIDAAKAVQEENENAAVAEVADNEKRKQSIIDFTATAQEMIRQRIDAQRVASETEKTQFLTDQSERAVSVQLQQQTELAGLQAYNDQVVALVRSRLGAEAALELETSQKRLIGEGKYQEAKLALLKAGQKAEEAGIFFVKSYEEQTQKERLASMRGGLGAIASLQASSSGELFAIGKAAALANATIDGIAAVQKALASAPPPINFALAALVGAAQAVNLAKIGSAKPPSVTGALNGALVTGGTAGRDTEPFMLSKGEIVAPAKSFDEVVEGTARQRGFSKGDDSAPMLALLQQIADRVGTPSIVVQGDVMSDEAFINRLADALRDAVQFRGAQLAT